MPGRGAADSRRNPMLTGEMLGSGPSGCPQSKRLAPRFAQLMPTSRSQVSGSSIVLVSSSCGPWNDRIAAVSADKELLQAAATRCGGDLCSALFSVCLCGLVGDLTVAA